MNEVQEKGGLSGTVTAASALCFFTKTGDAKVTNCAPGDDVSEQFSRISSPKQW